MEEDDRTVDICHFLDKRDGKWNIHHFYIIVLLKGGDGKDRQADYSEFMIQQFQTKQSGATTSLNFTFDLWLQRLQRGEVDPPDFACEFARFIGGSQNR